MTHKLQREQQLLNWIQTATSYRCQELEMVSGDASFRRYFRFHDADGNLSIVAVDAPPEFEDSGKFVDIALAYKQGNLTVPEVLAHDPEQGFYCLQDFGDRQFTQELSLSNIDELYQKAVAHLPAIQACQSVNGQPLPQYDDALLAAELYLFTHWLIEIHLDLSITEPQKQMLTSSYEFICEAFMAQPQVGVHRDYHSRNLMILQDDSIGVIDFQDAVIGPITYDLVSLLRDCYQSWSEEQMHQLLRAAHQTYFSEYPFDQFRVWFDLTGIQRHIKASGIFCRLYHRDGKSGYLNDVPHTLDYIIRVAKNYEPLVALSEFVSETVKPEFLARQQ